MDINAANAALDFTDSPFETEVVPIRGIPTRTYKNAPKTLRELLLTTVDHAERDYLVYEDERLTYGEHLRQVTALAAHLIDHLGVCPGDRVAIAMRNHPEWVLAFWAIACTGALVVPLNSWLRGAELEYCLADSGASLLIADGARYQTLKEHLGQLPQLRQVVVTRAEQPGDFTDWQQLLAQALAAGSALPQIPIAPEDEATIFYTSGTTGHPKGVLGTQRNIVSNPVNATFLRAREHLLSGGTLSSCMATLENPPANSGSLLPVPLFHVAGCHSFLLRNTMAGAKVVLMYQWSAERAIELIEQERLTTFCGVPAMAWQLLESPRLGESDLSSLSNIHYGGAPAAPELMTRLQQQFPRVSLSNGYGLTETSAVTTGNIGESYKRKPDSVGAPAAVAEVKIMNTAGTANMPPGEIGEIWVKGSNIVCGYWNKPEATAESFTDGWLHTGDLGYEDEEGYLYIVDRAKDMLIRGGENIYCIEVEDALFSHPDVVDAAVVGAPHRMLGEEVAAAVQLRADAKATDTELMTHVGSLLASFKVPVRIDFVTEPLPRNPNGKIIKPRVRELMGLEA